jgi:hypothetical protein
MTLPVNRMRRYFGDLTERRRNESLLGDAIRQRLIAETGDYLTLCLRHAERGVSIPSIPADKARFPRRLADHFWDGILFDL